MTHRPIVALVLFSALQAGCDSGVQEKTEVRTPMPAGIAGVYAGKFPCSNCASIEATLWLRPDGRFFLRQRFVDDAKSEQKPPTTTYGLGLWVWDEITSELVLHGAGPERRLVVADAEHLELGAATHVRQVLARDHSDPKFKDRFTLDGESSMTANGATFKECLTGLVLPVVVDAGAYRQLRHYHRTMNGSGKPALTMLEGHLVTAGEGTATSERLVVDQFISLKPDAHC